MGLGVPGCSMLEQPGWKAGAGTGLGWQVPGCSAPGPLWQDNWSWGRQAGALHIGSALVGWLELKQVQAGGVLEYFLPGPLWCDGWRYSGHKQGVSESALYWDSLSEIAGNGMGAGRGPPEGDGWSC